jgi:DNA-binding CsgD family transcriptional regulator
VAIAQQIPEKGMPLVENFTPLQYQNKGKIWDIESAQNGIVYMAADKGLLEFDGKTWNSFKGSKGFTRSLLVINDSLIYTGSDLDFGEWKKNKFQAFEYSSLYPFQKDISSVNEEFWGVHKQNDYILFASSQNIYVYKSNQLTKIAAPYKFTGSFSVDETLYFADEKNGLFVFNNLNLKQVFKYPENLNLHISGLYHHNNGIVVVTNDDGLYFYSKGKIVALNNSLSEKLKVAKVFSFKQFDESHLAFGTVIKGLYITDLNWNIIHHINKNKGILNNTILSLHYCKSGKLWLGLDYGISALSLNNSITYFKDNIGEFGTGYAALLKNDVFYLGTNQGLYKSRWTELNNDIEYSRFSLVPGTEGQVWTLEEIDNSLLIGHDKGLFVLQGNTILKICTNNGFWEIIPNNDYLLAGSYNGIDIFKKLNNTWVFVKKMELILGSCNQLILENDSVLWVNIPNYGIIRALLNSNLYPTDRLIFDESTFSGNYTYLLKDTTGIIVNTDLFQYTFNPETKSFIQKSEIVTQTEVDGVLIGINKSKNLTPHFKFFPIDNGFALKNLKKNIENRNSDTSIVLRKFEVFNNDKKVLLYPNAIIPYSLNNIVVEAIVPNQKNVKYQYKLDRSAQWSQWFLENSFDFISLSSGKHTFSIRASINGKTTEIKTITFRIAAPFYQSWYAYFFYVLAFIVAVNFIRVWKKAILKKQKKILLQKQQTSLREQAEKYRQEILILEQEQLKNEYNQLKQQLKSKTIELANKAKDNESKNKLLLTLKEKCDNAEKNPVLHQIKWNEMHRLLDSYLNTEDKTFEIQMDELHQEFFNKLKEQFPSLSNNDLRLCAYLKIGLNSKEIADILNIQPSSSYISRSRLRKKLNLKNDEDLYSFLNEIVP